MQMDKIFDFRVNQYLKERFSLIFIQLSQVL